MNDKQERESWIHVETSSQPHSWKQTWMFLGGAAVVFAFALLYEIDKDLQCQPDQASSDSWSQAIPGRSLPMLRAIASRKLPG
jgi:hypothetical protein|tara:strand:- start:2830 stop:3078 length:249 start_codon:yes stop_codon:yes gene_type:complete